MCCFLYTFNHENEHIAAMSNFAFISNVTCALHLHSHAVCVKTVTVKANSHNVCTFYLYLQLITHGHLSYSGPSIIRTPLVTVNSSGTLLYTKNSHN